MNGRQIILRVLTCWIILSCPSLLFANTSAPVITSPNSDLAPAINFNFENASLDVFLTQIEQIFQVSFIYDTQVKPEQSQKENAGEIKITFRTNKPLTNIQAWAVVDAFLDLAGLARVQISDQNQVYRITKSETARKEALPSFIGTNPNDLPQSGLIRYVYFLKNSNADQMKATIESLKSRSASISVYQDLNALIFSDHAYNIKTLMKIVGELDAACTPVSLSILKLKEADAVEVAQLYEDLKNKGNSQNAGYGMGASKSNEQNFLQQASVFAEPRTNTLIIIGPPDANNRIEKFITKNIDTKLAKRRSNINTIELNYIPAEQIATIFNELARFGGNTDAAKFGGTRGGEKYFSKMYFEAEKQGNSLIVRGEEEDFLVVKKIIEDLDKPQPQVALDVLIVTLESNSTKGITSQIDNKTNKNVNFQTSGFGGTGGPNSGSPILLSPLNSLASDLISLATSAQVGTTVLSLGKSTVWTLLGILSKDSKTNILANPFLVATNKYPAFVSLGEERRIVGEEIQGSSAGSINGIVSIPADLEVKVTPRINSLGTINLVVDVIIENFIYTYNVEGNGNKSTRSLHTNASVADGEVLAIGGLSRNINKNTDTSVPILGKIPIIGNFFKNKQQVLIKENLLIFITPKIVYPGDNLKAFTKNKASFIDDAISYTDEQEGKRDPVAKWLFKESDEHKILHDFTNKYNKPLVGSKTRQAISNAVANEVGLDI